jgi:hypothetical protein
MTTPAEVGEDQAEPVTSEWAATSEPTALSAQTSLEVRMGSVPETAIPDPPTSGLAEERK